MGSESKAIVCLTRGYHNLKQYDWLLERNKSIKQFINQSAQYPLIIFHEGNIPEKHQDYIREHSDGQTLLFIDISAVWVGGYEAMCRFQTYDIWNYCNKLDIDIIMRVDEDCVIQSCGPNPFDLNGNVYLRSVYFAESHSETNATLPGRIEELTGAKREDFYAPNKFVYTNVGIGSVGFWMEPTMKKLLHQIAYSEDQLTNRWGDLPVLGSLLNIYAQGRVGHIEGLKYRHISHNNEITSNGVD